MGVKARRGLSCHRKRVIAWRAAVYATALVITAPTMLMAESARSDIVAQPSASDGIVLAASLPRAEKSAAEGATAETDHAGPLHEIVVTARKRSESIVDVPVSITALDQESLKTFNVQTFADYATKIPNLAFNYGQAALGVADSAQIAVRGVSGANTTGFYIDDTPVPQSIDPRVIDIERIEALKGPQGTLYGSASMGGNVRLITRKPDVDNDNWTYSLQGGRTSGGGSPDYGVNTIANIVAIPNTLAVRAMFFYQHDAGFLTNVFPGGSLSDQGAIRTYGGSISARWKVSDNFDVTLRFLGQQTHYDGLPEAYAPLPGFVPNSYLLNRTIDLPESAANNFSLTSLDLEYRANSITITSSTSFFYNDTNETENSTESTVQTIAACCGVNLNPTSPVPFSWLTRTNQFAEEARVSASLTDDLSMIGGVFYLRQWGSVEAPPASASGVAASGLYPTDELVFVHVFSQDDSAALFGELYYKFLNRLTLTLGGRGFYLKQRTKTLLDGFFFGGPSNSGELEAKQTGFSPKVALAYAVTHDSNLYVSFSEGFRPGGAQIPPPPICDSGLGSLGGQNLSQFGADKVYTTELGFKSAFRDSRAYVSAAVFQTNWKNMQQSVVLPCTYAVTANTGEAQIRGAEFELNGEILPRLQIRAGLGFLHAVITDKGAGPFENGERIFQTPDFTGTLGLAYTFRKVGTVTPFATADYSYVANRLSENNPTPYPLIAPSYSVVNMTVGVDRGNSTLSLYAKNVTNAKPNLGDIQQIGFLQTTSLNGQTVPYPEVRLLHPLSIGLQFTQRF